MKQLIAEPQKVPILLKLGIWLSEKITGKRMIPARLLAWSPRLAVGAAVFESLVIHKDPTLSPRLLKLLRMQVSLYVACPFCIDMNSAEKEKFQITDQEIQVMQGILPADEVDSLDCKERRVLELAIRLSSTPLAMDADFTQKLKDQFSDREILILTATAAQVNYWARLIQSLGVSPAGFTKLGDVVDILKFK